MAAVSRSLPKMSEITPGEWIIKLRRAYLSQLQGTQDALKKVLDERITAFTAELDRLESGGGLAIRQDDVEGGGGPRNTGSTDAPRSQ